MKRSFDILMSFMALMCFLPIGLILAVALRCTGEGEIFFLHPRIGKGRNKFGLIKFATMLKDSPNIGTGDITLKNDPRLMPLGPFLRKTKLNEIPQLLNILKGDMSIIGPRPVTPKHFEYYPEQVKEEIGRVRPGLSGIGSIVFRDEESILAGSGKDYISCYKEDIAPYKGALESWYVKNRSFALDIKLIFLTLWVVFFPRSELFKKVLKNVPFRK
ncbi:sugar transferase [Fibrobacterota bacterium]